MYLKVVTCLLLFSLCILNYYFIVIFSVFLKISGFIQEVILSKIVGTFEINFIEWFSSIGLSLNVDKFYTMSFSRVWSSIIFPYTLSDQIISRSNGYIIVIGIKLYSSIIPRSHIEMICSNSFGMLSFVMRLTSNTKSFTSLKVLYCVTVHPVLEYGNVIWDTHLAIRFN